MLRLPEVVVDALEATLFLGQRATAEDGLEVDPLALNLIEVVQVLVELAQACLPDASLVLERLVVGRVLERVQQALVVAHLPNSMSEHVTNQHDCRPSAKQYVRTRT